MVTAPKIQEEIHQCRWLDCTIIFENAETLYEHITTVHIGRKSAGTLSLECKWQGCSSKASKRDHLTSHARVHINLKPHTCTICNKAFKRPQDLKKHEKIHTEEHHTVHKHSKAVTVNGGALNSNGAEEKHGQAPVQLYPPSYMAGAYTPFGYPMFPGQPGFDMATILAQQQQMNAQVQAGYPLGALGMQGMPGMPGFPMSYPGGMSAGPQAQPTQAQVMQMFAASNGMFFPGHPYGFHAPQQAMAMPQQQQQQSQSHHQPQPQVQQQPLRPPQSAPAPSTASATSNLYPSIPSMYANLYPTAAASPTSVTVKLEDMPSPAASVHSSHSSARSNGYSHHSSSVSPRVPALSPPSVSSPENTYSPPSEYETESYTKPYISTSVAGKKRAFEETAEQFLGDIKSKRFQGDDAVAQLDAMSHFLFTPELPATSLTPARSHDDSSGSSIASDYSNHDVTVINDLLLSLGQSIESSTPNLSDSYGALDSHAQAQQPLHQFNHTPLPAYTSSMYPSLHSMDRINPSIVSPRTANHHGQSIVYGGDYNSLGSARYGKAVAAPSISNDHKQPIYNHVNRLTRAAPVSSSRTEMQLDEAESGAKGYTSSIRSTSLDAKSELPVLAPILPSSRVGTEGVRLPSIASITSTSPSPSSPNTSITLPSIRDMLEGHNATSPAPISAPMSDSSSTTSTASSRTIYPSFPTSSSRSTNTPEPARPQSSGGMERLSHRVHKLDIRHCERSDSTSSSVAADDLSESEDDENDDHPSISKKSRVESPEPMSMDEHQPTEDKAKAIKAHEELKQRRLFVLQSLMIMVNAQYRKKLAAEALAKQAQTSAPAPAPAAPAPAVVAV